MMKKKWKQAGAALVVAGLTVTGASYVWADGNINLLSSDKDTETEVVENSTTETEVPTTDLNQDSTSENTEEPTTDSKEQTTTDPEESSSDVEEVSIKEILDESTKTEEKSQEEGVKEDEGNNQTPRTKEDIFPNNSEVCPLGNQPALAKNYKKVQNPNAKAAIKRNMERSIENCVNKQKNNGPQKMNAFGETKGQKAAEKPKNGNGNKSPQAQLNAKQKEERDELRAKQRAECEVFNARMNEQKEEK